ncbi:MAG: C39 family peptidase [Candidatus Dormibacteraeota bacterium]|nr:C39 family peptidase [Candidatus Dormibacteraeota bacterium]
MAALLATLLIGIRPSLPASAAPSTGGVMLDGWGGLHPFGGFAMTTYPAPYWNGWDIARAVAVRDDGSGGWVLDGWGGLHAIGGAPAIVSPGYWPNFDIARAFVVTSRDGNGIQDGRQGYLLDGYGGVHAWGGAPALAGAPYTAGQDLARGLEIHYSALGVPDGGWTMDRRGRTTAFGAAPVLPATGLPPAPIFQKLHGTATGGYVVPKFGVITTYGNGVAPYWNGYSDFGATEILRDIVLVHPTNPSPSAQPVSASAMATYQSWLHPRGGVMLDGWGGLHPFGGMPLNQSPAPYWPNWDVARSAVIRPDGTGGWILDAWGGIHAFGEAPAIRQPGYWPNWYIARAMVVTSRDTDGIPDGRQGYVLDGWGGLHPWGGAPALSGAPYTPYQDIARGLDIHLNQAGTPDGGWSMDRFGRVTAFGAAPPLAVTGQPGSPVMQHLHVVPGGAYEVSKWGAVTTTGSVAPYWAGYADWGSWDIMRDLVLVDPANPSPTPQPVSGAAARRLSGAVNLQNMISDPLIAQSRNLDCESAALRMALFVPGTNASEDWILAQMGADLRRAVVDQFGDVLRWGDPYQTFVGDVNGLDYNATGYGVYYPPIMNAAGRAGRSTLGGEGWNPHDLYLEVAAGNPVVVWVPVFGYWGSATMRTWTAWDGRQIRYTLVEHAMTMIGVDASTGTITLNDPNRGYVRTVSTAAFEAAFAKFNNMAVVVY